MSISYLCMYVGKAEVGLQLECQCERLVCLFAGAVMNAPPLPPIRSSHRPPETLVCHYEWLQGTYVAAVRSVYPTLCTASGHTLLSEDGRECRASSENVLTSRSEPCAQVRGCGERWRVGHALSLSPQGTFASAEEQSAPTSSSQGGACHRVSHGVSVRPLTIATHPVLLCREPRDRGLTRPTVLILLPFKSSALQVVNTMASLLLAPGQVWWGRAGGAGQGGTVRVASSCSGPHTQPETISERLWRGREAGSAEGSQTIVLHCNICW